jgi:hypothetical protein
MNAAAWERAKSLLAHVADLPAPDRERFVVEACPDLELRREVLELLASPAPLTDIVAAGTLQPGARLGPYVIERSLDRGAWAKSTRPPTRGWIARSPSRFSHAMFATIQTSGCDSCVKRKPLEL